MHTISWCCFVFVHPRIQIIINFEAFRFRTNAAETSWVSSLQTFWPLQSSLTVSPVSTSLFFHSHLIYFSTLSCSINSPQTAWSLVFSPLSDCTFPNWWFEVWNAECGLVHGSYMFPYPVYLMRIDQWAATNVSVMKANMHSDLYIICLPTPNLPRDGFCHLS